MKGGGEPADVCLTEFNQSVARVATLLAARAFHHRFKQRKVALVVLYRQGRKPALVPDERQVAIYGRVHWQ
jgi:hypothetical protein